MNDSSFPFNLIFNPLPGCPLEFVKFIVPIGPSTAPVTTRSLSSCCFIVPTSTDIESIPRMSLCESEGSIDEPEPMFMVGAPLRSDLTYAFTILTKSPGFRFSMPGRFAFSSHSFTLTVPPLSYTVIVLKRNSLPSLRENCLGFATFKTRVSSETSFAPLKMSFMEIPSFDGSPSDMPRSVAIRYSAPLSCKYPLPTVAFFSFTSSFRDSRLRSAFCSRIFATRSSYSDMNVL